MMTHLKKLCSLEGVSGRAPPVREYILRVLQQSPANMSVRVDPRGNVLAHVKGRERAKHTLLFAAHMDEVGFMITGVTPEGYLRFTTVGGIDPKVVYGRSVRVGGISGVIGGKATHLCCADEKKQVPKPSELLIDIGAASKEEAEALVHPGDTAVFAGEFSRLEGGLVKSRAIDDRAGCALLLDLAEQTPDYDMVLAFTVQEEVGLRGAKAAAFGVQPDIAVVVDATTAADTVGVAADKQVCRVGEGAVISFMDKRTLYDADLYARILEIAKKKNIRAQSKTMVAGGNDAGAIQLAGRGARVAAVSLPCRYLHSPACVVAKRDMEQTLALLQELARQLAV